MTCSACSGRLVPVTFDGGVQVERCVSCDGLHGTVTRAQAQVLVGLDRPMQSNSDEARYFDLTVAGDRVHGWYDTTTRRVVQYG